MKEFPSSLHLAAWKLGARPTLIAGTQTIMGLGWIIDYVFSFRRALRERCEIHHEVATTSSEEELGEAKKLKLEEAQFEEAELNI